MNFSPACMEIFWLHMERSTANNFVGACSAAECRETSDNFACWKYFKRKLFKIRTFKKKVLGLKIFKNKNFKNVYIKNFCF